MCSSGAEKYRKQVLAEAERAGEASNRDPSDAQKLKKWGFALIQLLSAFGEEDRYLEFLLAAKEKLEKSLAINSTDHEAMLYLGQVHLYILTVDPSMYLYDEDYTTHCRVAVKNFITVRDEAPELYEESNTMLEDIVTFLPLRLFSPSPVLPKMKYTELDEKEGEAMSLLDFQEDRRAAESEYFKNPDNADNLRKWGIALIELTWYQDSPIEKRKSVNDAIAKFSKALTLNPDDVETKLELVKARLLIVNQKDDGVEYQKLLEEYKLLGGDVKYEKVPSVKQKEAYELCKEYLEHMHDLALQAAREENKRKREC